MVVKTVLGSHFGLGEFAAHFRLYFSRIGMFTGGYRILTHGPWPYDSSNQLIHNSGVHGVP